jgi:hypothetical protein
VAEESAEEVAPALGRGINARVVGVEEAGVEVKEAAEGVIIDTMPGAYFFAFSKKPSSSERGRPRDELTFSQSTSSPCEQASTMAPSVPRFTERLFIDRIGSSTVSKVTASFLRSSTHISALFFGHNPTNICVSTRRVSSRISWIDIQFNSSIFTATIRGSSSFGCNGAKGTPVHYAKTQRTETRDNEQTLANRKMSK